MDWHTCDIFPERWIDLVVVLRCDHALLWTRLEKRFVHPLLLYYFLGFSTDLEAYWRWKQRRAYTLAKIQENNTAEIMEVVLEDARASYAEEIVVELKSESPEEVEGNVARIVAWVEAWRRDHAEDAA